jgi:hypothetical protein
MCNQQGDLSEGRLRQSGQPLCFDFPFSTNELFVVHTFTTGT